MSDKKPIGKKFDILIPPKEVLKKLANSVGIEIYHYYSWNPFVKFLFRKRLKTAIILAGSLVSKRVLDLGCGASFLSYNLARKGADTIALDLYVDLGNVKSIMDKLTLNKIHFIKGDGAYLPFKSNFFDVVFTLDVLEHIKNLHKAIEEIQRILRYKGIIVVSVPYESSLWFRISRIIARVSRKKFTEISIIQKIKAPHLHTLFDVINILKEYFCQDKKSDILIFPKMFFVASYHQL
ncbi:MAG: class I SAM-dependent methyltransferase [Candidatus Hodarchaeota archaeon]